MKTYDAIVIGSGGGAKIVQGLAKLGRRVALVEEGRTGGTCLNKGCIPSKMLIHPAGMAAKIRALRKLHIDAETKAVDFEALIASINHYTDTTSGKLADKLQQTENVDYYAGSARFTADHTVAVNGETLTAETIVIATGSRPAIPDIPGLSDVPYMTSEHALRNRKLPKRLVVLGGGYIAAELGGAYAGLGSDVTFILRSTFLRREDVDIIDEFTKVFGVDKTVHTHTQVLAVTYEQGVFRLTCRNEVRGKFGVEVDALLVATGVTPNADRLGLENTRVALDDKGFIHVDEYLQTAVPGVYAMGDVAGNFLFRHSVNFEAEYWLDARYLAEQPYPIAYPPMPSAVFTHPEIASVGVTEAACRQQGLDPVVATADYPSCAMALARGLDHGRVKLLFDRGSGRLLGAHIVGEEASTLIQELVLAMTTGLAAGDIYRQIYIHPAFPEVVRNAVRTALLQLDPRQAILFG